MRKSYLSHLNMIGGDKFIMSGYFKDKNLEVYNLLEEYNKLKLILKNKTIEKKVKEDFSVRFGNSVLSFFFFIVFFVTLANIKSANNNMKIILSLILLASFISFIYTVRKVTKLKTIKINLSDNEIEEASHKSIRKDFFSRYKYVNIKILGKIFYDNINSVTENIKREYVGEVYIGFPKNTSDEYILFIYNDENSIGAIKHFKIQNIIQSHLQIQSWQTANISS